MTDSPAPGAEARAARREANGGTLTVALGAQDFTFLGEIPLDISLALDELNAATHSELRAWFEAHLLADAACDGSCAENGMPLLARDCPDETRHRKSLRKVRNADGSRVSTDAFHDFHQKILEGFVVTEGESGSSAGSSPTAGERSNGTAPGPASTPPGSGVVEVGGPEGS